MCGVSQTKEIMNIIISLYQQFPEKGKAIAHYCPHNSLQKCQILDVTFCGAIDKPEFI